MPLQQTSGAASYDAFGGGAPVAAKYIEDFFQTWLRTGTGSSTTVTTGLNASINKSLVWTKSRSATTNHKLTDTARGVTKALSSNTTGAEVTDSQGLTAFSSTGYTIGTNTDYNNSGATYVDWQWVATPKFFDVVTYTGNGVAGRQLAHNLGSVPGCMIVKRTDAASDQWWVYHRSLPVNDGLALNTTFASNDYFTPSVFGNNSTSIAPTSTVFTVGTNAGVNANGGTYVAYLFAHNAGGFGLTGTDNVISCGSFTDSATVNLGYEPQWIMVKRTNTTGDWVMVDTMRGLTANFSGSAAGDAQLLANTSGAELAPPNGDIGINSTGFRWNGSSGTYIYIAIRRGPMKTPTTGTSVFYPNTVPQGDIIDSTNVPFPPDLVNTFSRDGTQRTSGYMQFQFADRLRSLGVPSDTFSGSGCPALISSSTGIEGNSASYIQLRADGRNITRSNGWNNALYGNWIYYFMRRAPGFMDVCCYTGSGTTTTQTHNLQAVPELIIVKRRNGTAFWQVYSATYGRNFYAFLNDTQGFSSDPGNAWGTTDPTTTTFSLSPLTETNASGSTYVAYLFASVPGVSRVGSYTGTGTTQTINCGFAAGARFVMIKRADASGDWFVWDTARGIVSGNDPHLSLNTTAAEVTSNDTIDTDSTGFVVNQVSATNVNVSSATYIFLAIA